MAMLRTHNTPPQTAAIDPIKSAAEYTSATRAKFHFLIAFQSSSASCRLTCAAVRRWPKDKITLRNRARVIERSWRD